MILLRCFCWHTHSSCFHPAFSSSVVAYHRLLQLFQNLLLMSLGYWPLEGPHLPYFLEFPYFYLKLMKQSLLVWVPWFPWRLIIKLSPRYQFYFYFPDCFNFYSYLDQLQCFSWFNWISISWRFMSPFYSSLYCKLNPAILEPFL